MIIMGNEKFYRVIVACGHLGHRNSIEVTRYFKDYDILSCYFSAFQMPRSKKKPGCVKLVETITENEYLIGKKIEKENLYLQTFKGHRNNVA